MPPLHCLPLQKCLRVPAGGAVLVEEGGEWSSVGAQSGWTGPDAGAAADAEGWVSQHFPDIQVNADGSGRAYPYAFSAEGAAVGGQRDRRSWFGRAAG